SREMRHGRTAHCISSSSLRNKSELSLFSRVRYRYLRNVLANIHEVLSGTKLWILFFAVPFSVIARYRDFGSRWVFCLSLLGLVPLAERVSFLTEQTALFTGPTVGGLLNATCGNATELIIAISALLQHKVEVVKCSLLGSVLSNLLLVLGSSLFLGGITNLTKEQKFDRKQADVNSLLLLLGLLCNALPLMFKFASESPEVTSATMIQLSRAICVVMLIAYVAYLVFQLWTHRNIFEEPKEQNRDDDNDDLLSEDSPVMGFWCALLWLVLMTGLIALLSEYVVGTIEAASDSWGLSVSFISVILLPIVGNAAEHAGALIFAFKNKLDISLGVALGSATQIALFVTPFTVLVSWIVGISMDISLDILETGSLFLSILIVAFTLQEGTSHYIKGLVLLLSYVVIGVCFFL
ncbi:hypothetical protein M569_06047, partial [Genlisea aurea]